MLKRAVSVVPVLLLPFALTACGGKSDDGASSVSCSYPSAGPAAKPVKTPASKASESGKTEATIHTSEGDVPITLDAASAPCAVNSFLSLAKQGYFDDTPCHRLTKGDLAVLQCGDPTGVGNGGPGYSFADELRSAATLPEDKQAEEQAASMGQPQKLVTYPAGALAMANGGPDTNGSQFFLVYAPSALPPSYTYFGTIGAAGVATVQKVAKDGEIDNPQMGVPGDGAPKDKVEITSVSVG